jgi:hypothetical protein
MKGEIILQYTIVAIMVEFPGPERKPQIIAR